MSWDDFILLVRKDAALRKKIQRIAYYAIFHFDVELLDFELPVDALAYREDNPDDPQIESSQIFSEKPGRVIIPSDDKGEHGFSGLKQTLAALSSLPGASPAASSALPASVFAPEKLRRTCQRA